MENNISVLSFVYNEEKHIDRWCAGLKPYVSEIIIFDLESTDNTYELCKKYTDKVYKRPYLLCGDSYKQELHYLAKGNWILWSYPDENFPDTTLKALNKLIGVDRWNAFSFMRHEYMDDIRVCFKQGDKILAFGTPESPNYQCRLHRNDGRIFYTGLVHAELHGNYSMCNLPPEYYMEHFKTSSSQEFDNIRLYILYKASIFKYGDTAIEPYRTYVNSYKKIVGDSEKKNLSGERKIHLAEEFWWNWRRYTNVSRITLEEFQKTLGISYPEFLDSQRLDSSNRFVIESNIKDPILKEMEGNATKN